MKHDRGIGPLSDDEQRAHALHAEDLLEGDARSIAAPLAEAVRQVCVDAARVAYEDASLSGLCAEGAREAAVSAIRAVRLDALIERVLAARRTRAPEKPSA